MTVCQRVEYHHPMDYRVQPILNSLIPISYAIISLALGLITLTLPSRCAKRALPVVLSIAFAAFHHQNDFSSHPLLNEMFGRLFLLWISYMCFLVYLKGYDGASHTLRGRQHRHCSPSWQGHKSETPGQTSREKLKLFWRYVHWHCRSRGRCALKMLFNGRGIGTEWQIAQLPSPRSAASPTPQNEVGGSRARFLTRRALALLAKCLIWHLWGRYVENLVRIGQDDYAPEKRFILRRIFAACFSKAFGTRHPYISNPVTFREIQVRLWLVFTNNVPSIIVLKAFHDVCAMFFVGFGFDSPGEWPPFFGKISDAYTVRGYWSRFWQLLLYRIFTGVASLTLRKVFLIRRRSGFSHLIHTLLVFLISGIFHAIVNVYTMPGSSKLPVVCFYSLQPLGFAIEGVVQYFWRGWRQRHSKGLPVTKTERALVRVVGYIWVILWFSWSEPKASFAEHYSIRQYWEHQA